MVLYNNGFAGGFVCVFFVGIINGLKPELLETVAPVAPVAPTWTKNISEAFQSYQFESMRTTMPDSEDEIGQVSFVFTKSQMLFSTIDTSLFFSL